MVDLPRKEKRLFLFAEACKTLTKGRIFGTNIEIFV
jgi:hypothetical protein